MMAFLSRVLRAAVLSGWPLRLNRFRQAAPRTKSDMEAGMIRHQDIMGMYTK
jgi:hypothetical protein